MLLLPFRKKGMYDIYINGGHVYMDVKVVNVMKRLKIT